MKLHTLALMAAASVCCLSCVETDYTLGGDFLPLSQRYTTHTAEAPLGGIEMRMADGLSGYSSSRITVGAVRDDSYGLTTRSGVLTLVPMIFGDEGLDLGKNPEFKSFRLTVAKDTLSAKDPSQLSMLQNINVYELAEPLDRNKTYDCNQEVALKNTRLTSGTPVYSGGDSLTFYFTEEYGRRFLELTKDDLKDMDSYLKKIPGICLSTDAPMKNGGRINMFELQLSVNPNYKTISGNYAHLRYSAEYKGERRDTSIIFMLGANDLFKADSLLNNSSTGSFPEYSLNLCGHETRSRAGKATDRILIEGGGGLKPVISARELKRQAEEMISAAGYDPATAVINKASLIFPFEFPENYLDMEFWPYRLSPTCKVISLDEEQTPSFMGLSDSSNKSENQGDINRSVCRYSPDITYHLQELLRIDENDSGNSKTRRLDNGSYDIWLLVMAQEITTTTSSASSDMSEYYQYLAYQSYYNSMYGGYGGYGGYGYGGYGYGYDPYTNYYNYAMLAAYASQSQTTTNTTIALDRDRFYSAALCGPEHSDEAMRPVLKIAFSIPME